jgi:O-antigen/teichoic acid export membrane protein
LDQIFSFLVFVVIARILGPVEVGLFALGMIVAELGRIFAVSGFGDAVTKARDEDEEQVSRAAFWGNMIMAVACSLLITLLAMPIAWVMQAERLEGVLIALAWTIPLSAGGAIHMARLMRRFGHKTLAIRSFIAGIIGSAVALYAAYHGFGVYSLVVQRFITEAVTMLTAWFAFRWWPSLNFTRSQFVEILPFSVSMSASKLMGVIVSRIQDIVIGMFAGPAAVGVYRVARRTVDMMMIGTLTPLSTVAVNFLVAVRDDKVRFGQSFLRMTTIASCIAFPSFFGLAAIGGDLIPLIYGPKWAGAVPVLQLLSPLCIPLVVSLFTVPVLTAHGESRKIAQMSIWQLVISLALTLPAAPLGVEAIVLSLLARTFVMIPYQLSQVAPYTGASTSTVLKGVLRPLIASILMAIVCYVSLTYGMSSISSPYIRITIALVEGVALYGVLLLLIDRQSVAWLTDMLRAMKERRGTSVQVANSNESS